MHFRRHEFHPWLVKIPWKRAWQLTPVFLPGESPWREEPGGLQSMGSQRVGHDFAQENKRAGRTVRRAVKLWGDGEIRHFSIKDKKVVRRKWKKERGSNTGEGMGRKKEINRISAAPLSCRSLKWGQSHGPASWDQRSTKKEMEPRCSKVNSVLWGLYQSEMPWRF